MAYRIDAGLDGRARYLRVLDADSDRVRLAWAYPGEQRSTGEAEAESALHDLFRELFLLTAADYLSTGEK